MTEALIIFIKNPIKGKVKTRIAATLGEEKALEIYLKLLHHTRQIALKTNCKRFLFYDGFIDNNDEWSSEDFNKKVQDQSPDLGERMYASFMDLLQLGQRKVLIIGSDCPELTPGLITASFDNLAENPAILGPATDGGYYSIGFNFEMLADKSQNVLSSVFLNKTWSHEKVAEQTRKALHQLGIYCFETKELNDADTEADVRHLI